MKQHIDRRYTGLVEVGQGGMATVFRATDTQLERDVAIKVILPEHAGKPKFRSRFEREVKALARLHHPNIVAVYDYHSSTECSYYVMPLIEGKLLKDLIAAKGKSPDLLLSVMRDVLSALSYAHGKNVIHRDVKPENIIIDSTGRVYLTDFGIAHIDEAELTKLTQQGSFLGTPAYASPEQIEGERLTPASDIYSLGIVLYEFITGAPPFRGTMNGVITGHLTKEPPPIAPGPLPEAIRSIVPIVMRMIAKKPQDRYSGCDEILALLGGYRGNGGAVTSVQKRCERCGAELKSAGTLCDKCALANRKAGPGDTVRLQTAGGTLPMPGGSEVYGLPLYRRRLKDTARLMERLKETRTDVSRERYRELGMLYRTRMEALKSAIGDLSRKGELRLKEISGELKKTRGLLARAGKDMKEIELLRGQSALTGDEYSRRRADCEKRIAETGRVLAALESEESGLRDVLDGGCEKEYPESDATLIDSRAVEISGMEPGVNLRARKFIRRTAFILTAALLIITAHYAWDRLTARRGIVKGNNIALRKTSSLTSPVLLRLKKGEPVVILDERVSRTSSEGMTRGPVFIESAGAAYTIPAGSSLTIIYRTGDSYYVAFRSGGREIRGLVPVNELSPLKGKTWYQIKTDKDVRGWVLARFIEQQD